MIELFNILISTIIFLFIFSFPVPITSQNNFFLNVYDRLLINIVLHSNFFLILSFFNFNISIIFFVYLLIGFFFLLFFLKENRIYLKNNFLTIFFYTITLNCIFVYIAQNAILNWDGAAHWFYKAQNFFQESEYKNLNTLPFNYYPHLGSYIWAFFWKNSLLQLEYIGRFFFVFLLVTCCFSLGQQLNMKFSNFEKILISLVLIYFSTNFFLLGGYQEYFLFFTFFTFGRFFILYQEQLKIYDQKYLVLLILLTSNLFLWIKQEGFFYFFIINTIFLFYVKSKIYLKFLFFFLCSLLVLFFIKIRTYFFGSVTFNEEIVLTEFFSSFLLIIKNLVNYSFYEILYKFFLITKYILISFIKYPIWIVIILSSLVLFFKNKLSYNNFFLSYFFLHLALIYLVYFIHYDINILLPLTLSRLIFPISGLYVFFIIILLNKLKK
jgi:hypothetical protein